MHNNLKTKFCGMSLDSPIVLLSGCVGFGEEYTRIQGFSNADVGAICLKGTTLEPRLGNIPHRVTETPSGMINAIGLQNPGTDVVINDIMPNLDKTETRFIIHISGSSVEEYGEIANGLMTLILMLLKSISRVRMLKRVVLLLAMILTCPTAWLNFAVKIPPNH